MAKTLMLVEDDPDLREDLAYFIRQRGVQVIIAGDGREALAHLEAGAIPALIILDLMLPVMDGWSLRAALLADARFANIPVVLLSGIAQLESEKLKMKVGHYLTKPIDLDELNAVIDAHC